MITNTNVESKTEKRSLARERVNLLLFSSGKLISLFGSAIYSFAIGLYLLKTTGSGLTFATNIVLYTLPMVFINPIAGVIADRINKKIVVVGADFLNGLFLLSVYLLALKTGLSIPLVYISTLFMTILSMFCNIGIEAAKPNLVSKEKLVDINSLARVIESGSYVVGPMLGGLIFAFIDMKLFILINALSFILAAVMEYFIDYKYNESEVADTKYEEDEGLEEKIKESIWYEMKEGYQYIFKRQHMQALVYIFIALNFFFNYSVIVPLPYLLNTTWEVDSSIYGIVQGGLPVGMIIGALYVKKMMSKVTYSKLLKRISYSTGLGVVAFILPLIFSSGVPNSVFILVYYTALMIMGGIVVSWVDVPLNILVQQIVPGKILGRVISVKLSIVKIIVPVALILSGYLLNHLSPLFLFISGAFIFTIFNLCFFKSSLGRKFIKVSNNSINDRGEGGQQKAV